MRYMSRSPRTTELFAARIARSLARKKPGQRALVIALEGELGVGKTVFVRGFARALGVKSKVSSPTFTLMRQYRIRKNFHFSISSFQKNPKSKGSKHSPYFIPHTSYLVHLDCYRLRNEKDFRAFHLKGVLSDPKNIVLIEWAERVKRVLPKKHIKVHIDHIGARTRKITIV